MPERCAAPNFAAISAAVIVPSWWLWRRLGRALARFGVRDQSCVVPPASSSFLSRRITGTHNRPPILMVGISPRFAAL
jgi:hypothetical protein